MSGERHDSFDIHGILRLRTNARLVPAIPEYFRVSSVNPDLTVTRLRDLEDPEAGQVVRMVGHPRTCDLGGGHVFYECPLPLLQYLGVSGTWRFYVAGLDRDETSIRTAVPFVWLKPVEARVTELLSRIVYSVMNLRFWRKGYAMCHASAVARGDEAFVFFGYIGSGKTTLGTDLLESVCDGSLSDDSSLVSRDGTVYAWPEYHPSHVGGVRLPGLRYVSRRQHETVQPDFPIRRKAPVRAIFFLEAGSDKIEEIGTDEAIRKAVLVNIDELSRFWNSPASQILGQYAYFYPQLDLAGAMAQFAKCTASFVGAADRCFVIRSRSPRYPGLRDLIGRLA